MVYYWKYNSKVMKYKSLGTMGLYGERHGGGQIRVCAGGLQEFSEGIPEALLVILSLKKFCGDERSMHRGLVLSL